MEPGYVIIGYRRVTTPRSRWHQMKTFDIVTHVQDLTDMIARDNPGPVEFRLKRLT